MQVCSDALYLTDDNNRAVFPNETGEFNVTRLFPGGHYEVHGDSGDHAQVSAVGVASNASVASAQPMQFAFAQRSAGPVCSQNRRLSSAPKTFQRYIKFC